MLVLQLVMLWSGAPCQVDPKLVIAEIVNAQSSLHFMLYPLA